MMSIIRDHWYDIRYCPEAPPSGTVECTLQIRSDQFSRPCFRDPRLLAENKNLNKKQKTSLVRSGKSLCGRLCVLLRSVLVVRRGDGH